MRGTQLEKLKTGYEGPPFLKCLEEESPKFKENPKGCGEEFRGSEEQLQSCEHPKTSRLLSYINGVKR